MIFIDLQNAYNSISRNGIWQAPEKYNIAIRLIKIIKKLYAGNRHM
jgi:hypothetical protein